MSKGKVGILENVLGKVEQFGTLDCQYTNEKGCRCAVGWVMDECGVNMDIFKDEKFNEEPVSRLFQNRDIAEPLMDYGFSVDELERLQEINDDIYDKYERSVEVIHYIREMIKELK